MGVTLKYGQDEEDLNIIFGQRIFDLMIDKNMDIAKLARKAGIKNRQKLSTVINAYTDTEKKNPRALTPVEIMAVAEALEVSPAFLLTGYDESNNVIGEELGLSNDTINRLRYYQGKNDNTMSDAINMFFADSDEIESNNMTSAEELLFLFREFVLCPERELIVKTMNATNPAFALTRDEALQLRIINHLSEYRKNHNKTDENANQKGGKEK